ncbi:hypothetical protein T06_17015 [Trichinella sp. T6]|nr:hypothetical protein T06_17015 [Trichinella sp. T6]
MDEYFWPRKSTLFMGYQHELFQPAASSEQNVVKCCHSSLDKTKMLLKEPSYSRGQQLLFHGLRSCSVLMWRKGATISISALTCGILSQQLVPDSSLFIDFLSDYPWLSIIRIEQSVSTLNRVLNNGYRDGSRITVPIAVRPCSRRFCKVECDSPHTRNRIKFCLQHFVLRAGVSMIWMKCIMMEDAKARKLHLHGSAIDAKHDDIERSLKNGSHARRVFCTSITNDDILMSMDEELFLTS